jgi:hypothetical protein
VRLVEVARAAYREALPALSASLERLGVEIGFVTRIEDGIQYIEHSVGDHHTIQPGEQCVLNEAYCRRTVELDGHLSVQDAATSPEVSDVAYETFGFGSYIGSKIMVDDEVYESSRENAEGLGLDAQVGQWFDECYITSEVHRGNPYLYPMKARDHAGLPPATVLTAEFDPLRDEGLAYAERLAEAGVRVTQENYEGMIHGFFGMLQEPFDLEAAHDAMELVAGDLAESFDA